MGTVGNYPQVIIVKTDLMNVPRKENLAQSGFDGPWIHPTPAVYDPESWFWKNPAQHNV
jgi:peptide/nickel transport system substrate-binding protein